MAAILRAMAPALLLSSPPSPSLPPPSEAPRSLPCFFSKARVPCPLKINVSPLSHKSIQQRKIRLFATYGETTEAEESTETATKEDSYEEIPLDDGATDGSISEMDEAASTVTVILQSYKEALAKSDESKIAEIEGFLQSIENERNTLSAKVATLSEELLIERDRVLRISADFDNFRKRTERERLSLMTNVQGEVIESLLPVLDNFERAKAQIKVETEGEEKINNSYQSIYKQFLEILTSLGVEAVETVGSPFDPLLHEAIMREESTEFDEGIIIQEFRKGFKLGERLLRPSMVKVSAGPGPAKSEDDAKIDGNAEVSEEGSGEGEDSA